MQRVSPEPLPWPFSPEPGGLGTGLGTRYASCVSVRSTHRAYLRPPRLNTWNFNESINSQLNNVNSCRQSTQWAVSLSCYGFFLLFGDQRAFSLAPHRAFFA